MAVGKDESILERHLQTTIQIIIVAIMLWFGNAVTNNGKALVRLTTQLDMYSQQSGDHEKRIRVLEISDND